MGASEIGGLGMPDPTLFRVWGSSAVLRPPHPHPRAGSRGEGPRAAGAESWRGYSDGAVRVSRATGETEVPLQHPPGSRFRSLPDFDRHRVGIVIGISS